MSSQIQRRSPVHDLLEELGPKWIQIQGMKTALWFQSPEIERTRKTELALCDVSCLARMSLKGPEAVAWLESIGIKVPATLYECSHWNGEGLIIRTDLQEILLEEGLAGGGLEPVLRQYNGGRPGVYRVERQEASFLLGGAKVTDVLMETCGYDFRKPGTSLVMTRVAGVSCAVLPLEGPAFRLWLDCSYAVYLWEALYEIVRDHGGDAVGLGAFFPSVVGS